MPSRHRTVSHPVLGPAEIERERALSALRSRLDCPIRFVCAPAGSGKTTLLRQYAARTPRTVYLAAEAGMSVAALMRTLESALDLGELLLDDLDLVHPEAVTALMNTAASGALGGLRLIVAGRSRRLLHVQNIIARGFGIVLDGAELAFDAEETQRLAERLGLTPEANEITELLHVTEGWTLPLTWILRDAAAEGRVVRDAFERWSSRHGHLLLEFVAENSSHDPAVRHAFVTALREGARRAQPGLAELEIAGCPIVRSRGALRPYRVLRRLSARGATKARPDVAELRHEPLALTLLGRFACRIGERPVVFARRRDQNVLLYVALAPEARVTRNELLAAFWPGVPHGVACQGLRTTLSRLRRAIAETSGSGAERFLRIDSTISLDLENVTIDARRFVEHVACGEVEESRGEVEGAVRHYRAAERLYADHLLASEAVEPALAPHVADYAARFRVVLDRLADLSMRAREVEAARSYERRAISLRTFRVTPQSA